MVDIDKFKKEFKLLQAGRNFIHKQLSIGDFVFNARNTGEDKSLSGKPWIEYWKEMTGKEIPNICPFCGKTLREDEAEGCHIVFPKGIEVFLRTMGKDVPRLKYIIPGHHNCNCHFGELMQIKHPVEAVFALTRKVEK